MANTFDIPFLIPLKMSPVKDQQYINYDTATFKELIKPFQSEVSYVQKWHSSMVVKAQIPSTYSPIKFDAINCEGVVISTYEATSIVSPAIMEGYSVYEFNMIPPTTDSIYYFVLSVGTYNPDPEFNTHEVFISEPQKTIRNINGMLVFEYTHSRNDFDIIFSGGAKFTFMCEGGFGRPMPKRVGSSFRTSHAATKINTVIPLMEHSLILGDARGVPAWVSEKVNRAFCCDVLLINGRLYTCPEGNDFEVRTVDYYPMYGYKVNILETVNRYSLRIENGAIASQYFFVSYDIETRAFGTLNGPAGQNIMQITKIG